MYPEAGASISNTAVLLTPLLSSGIRLKAEDKMPFYQVYHSYDLNGDQRQKIASAITQLHCQAFQTPAFFVHVSFIEEGTKDKTYFLAGKAHDATSNRIIGTVRMSATRSKADFDELGAKMEAAWYNALDLTSPTEKESWDNVDEPKRLLMVTFVPMVTIREGGMAIPEAGQEESWLKEQLPYIESMADKGIEDFAELLSEVKGK
ncbi:hypothetical protein ACHAO9_007096 [Fusarium lateritium]